MTQRPWVVIDFETRSAAELSDVGAETYADHHTTEALCIAWQWPGARVEVVEVRDNEPVTCAGFSDLAEHVAAGGVVVAHNAGFELAVWRMLHDRRPDVWPRLTIEQTHCTMAAARAVALPGGLDALASAINLPLQKDLAGRAVMMKMTKPRRLTKREIKDGADASALSWYDTPELRARLMEYCKIDVEVQTLAWQALPKLPVAERAIWELDQRINQRGVGIDRAGCAAALQVVSSELVTLNSELAAITGGAVPSINARAKLQEWLASQGCMVENLRAATVEAMIPHVKGDAKRALEIRSAASKSSTAKLLPMLEMSATTGRARGTLSYHRATTGRWAGSGIQTQNLPRTPKGWKVTTAEQAIEAMRAGDAATLLQYFDKWGGPHNLVSNCLRSLIRSADDARLMAADYSNIEGRGLAWLAGEAWKLQAFRDVDAGRGADLYKLAFSKAFGIPVDEVDEYQRQIGKVMELALGYAGSIGAFLSMCANYNIDLAKIAEVAARAVDPVEWENACEYYDRIQYDPEALEEAAAEDDNDDMRFLEPFKGDPRRGLPREQFAAIRCIVRGWRAGHPRTVSWWKALDGAAIAAVDAWGTVHQAGPVSFVASRSALRCKLPSGRYLTYPFARVVRGESRKTGKVQTVLLYSAAKGQAKKWRPTRAYGGLLAENITQAVARDLLANALINLERAGYATVMHVHDEVVAEVRNGTGSLSEFRAICEQLPAWANGLPFVTGEPWEGIRYRK